VNWAARCCQLSVCWVFEPDVSRTGQWSCGTTSVVKFWMTLIVLHTSTHAAITHVTSLKTSAAWPLFTVYLPSHLMGNILLISFLKITTSAEMEICRGRRYRRMAAAFAVQMFNCTTAVWFKTTWTLSALQLSVTLMTNVETKLLHWDQSCKPYWLSFHNSLQISTFFFTWHSIVTC